MSTRQRVAVVTGGGGGIGGAIAENLGRSGGFVVTVDPLVRALTAEDRVKALEAERARLYVMLALSLLSASVLLVLWLLEVFR